MTSYLTCTNCGQKSPDSAGRCKNCGRAFGRAEPAPGNSGLKRDTIPVAVLLAGAAFLVFAAFKLWPAFATTPASTPAESTAVAAPRETTTVATAPPTPAPKPAAVAPADTVRAATQAPARKPESPPPAPDSVVRVRDTAATTPTPPPAEAEPVTIDVAHQRIAQVPAFLRAEPSKSGAVVRILQAGEVVTVDSLVQGWYRVVTDSQGVGYVGQQYLDTLPPRR